MAMGDLDGDGKQDVLTGKRLFAHHGRDVSTYDPLAGSPRVYERRVDGRVLEFGVARLLYNAHFLLTWSTALVAIITAIYTAMAPKIPRLGP